jgi:hypothetical protein
MVNLSNDIIACIVVSVCYMVWTHFTSETKPTFKTYIKNGVFGFGSTYALLFVMKKLLSKDTKPVVIGGGSYQENILVGDPNF